MLVSLSLATPQKRLSKEEFLKLAKQAQKRYLEAYPNSKHRFLLAERQRKTKEAIKVAKPARLPKAEPAKLRRLSKVEFNALDEKGKQRYNERFPKSGHTPRFRTGKRKDLSKKRVDGKESTREAQSRRKEVGVTVDKQRNTMHDEGAGTINKQSVMALATIKPEQLRQGAVNINNNRDEIHGLVDQEIQRRPHLFSRGLASVRDMMQGGLLDDDVIDGEFTEVDDTQAEDEDGQPLHDEEGKPITKKQKKQAEDEAGPDPSRDEDKDPSLDDDDEDDEEDDDFESEEERRKRKKKKKKKKKKDEKKKRDGMAVLGAVAKFALLGAGVALLAIGAGPLGMVIGRGLVDLWSNMESNAANNPEKTQEELDHDTVDEILTHTVSYMKNMDLTDLHQSSQHLFKAIAATKLDIYNECFSAILPLVRGRPTGRPGKNFFGTSNVNVEVMAYALKKRLTELNVLRDFTYVHDGDECYMFFCNDPAHTLVALGATNTEGLYHVAFLNW